MKNMELRIIFIGVQIFFLYNLTGIHATKKCYQAKICIHNGIEKCGKDKDGNVRRFLDSCDIKEYNCLQETEYVQTQLWKCKDLPPLSEKKGVKKPQSNKKHGMKLSLSSPSDVDSYNSQAEENMKLNGYLTSDTDYTDIGSKDLQKIKLKDVSSSKDEYSDYKDDYEEYSDSNQVDADSKFKGDLNFDFEATDSSSKAASSFEDEDSDYKDDDEEYSDSSDADEKMKLNADIISDTDYTYINSKDLQKNKLKAVSSSKDEYSDFKVDDEECSASSQADANSKLNGDLNFASENEYSDYKNDNEEFSDGSDADEKMKLYADLSSDMQYTDIGSKDLQKFKLSAQFASSTSVELDKRSDSSN